MSDVAQTESRKLDHIDIVLNRDVNAKGVTTGFDRYFFEHEALPDLDFAAIETELTLFGKRLKAPLLISSMTGGADPARAINLRLAEAAEVLGVAMGVGSQRAAIEAGHLDATYQVRRVAPSLLLFANLGAVQFNYGLGVGDAQRAVDMIEADALFLHLNPLQEVVQAEGDRDWGGLLRKIEQVARALPVPVVAKEVGNGIGPATARRLVDAGVQAIDVAGAGGTSWSEVEAHRQPDPFRRRVAHTFAAWGTPTALALRQVRASLPRGVPVFASGGIRDGLDVAKAVALGATLVGSAAPLLGPATGEGDEVLDKFRAYIEELRIAMFCVGAGSLAQLRQTPLRRVDNWEVL
ncbi:MAG: type 2 isopentenyl-diphosphate Delta-isomerase [Geodermatophilaceae bacterium]|nr:type 2 isopentenyl-diphosphate Delta-isomerase [Geodermatophilaceae bacterium]